MTSWPIYYPGRPAIPFDSLPDSDHYDQKRSKRRLAEAGKRKGAPVRRVPLYAPPHYCAVNKDDKPQ